MALYIRAFRARGFRALEDVALDGLAPSVALFGLNRHGKTSIQAALHMLLHGRCRYTDKAGRGAEALIRDGQQSAYVEADLETDAGALTVGMTLKRSGSNEWWCARPDGPEPAAKDRADLWRLLGVDPRVAAVAAMPDLYLDSGEAEEVMAATLVGSIDPADVDGWLGAHRAWTLDFAARKRLSLDTPQDYAALGAEAYTERTGQNRLLKDARAQLDGLQPVTDRERTDALGRLRLPAEIPGIEAGLRKTRGALAALHEELGRAHASRPAEEVAADRGRLEAALAEARQTLESTQAAVATAEAEAERTQQAVDDARREEANAAHAGRQASDAQARAEKALAALTGEGGACPTCGRKYTEKLRADLLGPLEAQRDAARTAAEDAASRTDELRHGLQAVRDAAQACQDTLRRLAADRQAQASEVARIEAGLDALQDAAGDTRPAVDIEAEIAEAAEKVERGERLVKALERLAQRQDLEGHIAAVEAEVAHLDWAVKGFKDGELLKPLLAAGLEAFAARCSAALAPFGYSLGVDVDGKRVTVLLQPPGQEARPVRLCSEGEQALAALAVAVGHADGGAPVQLDNLNDLDHAWTKEALRLLRAHAGGSLWVSGAWQKGDADLERFAAALSPASVVWVQDGTAGVVEAAGAAAAAAAQGVGQ